MAANHEGIGLLMADITRLMRRSYEQRREEGMPTLAQGRALAYLARHEGCRQVELADLLEVQPITLARLIDQLAGDGLVERRVDPQDRRAYRLYLSPAAAPRMAALQQVAAKIQDEALVGLDDELVEVLMSALLRMRANLAAG